MATQKIKGITIEINGETTGLSNALKKVNSDIKSVDSELKEVNKLLKLDPTNVQLLAQKHELLSTAIKDTTNKLNSLNEAKRQADERIASGKEEENSKAYRELEREIISTSQSLDSLVKSFDENEKAMNGNTSDIKKFSEEEEKAGNSTIKLGDLIKANLISDAIKSGLKGLVNSIKEVNSTLNEWSSMSNALKEQEAKLTRVMKNTTNATDDEIQSLINLTAEQEKLGVVSQETQLAGLQELGTYVEQKESLEKLLPVMNDMIAQQYGVGASMESASSIATMLGKVLGNGQVSALSKLGYKFDETQEKILKYGTEEEKAAMLAEVIQQSVGGMNEALAQTDAGKVALINSHLDDMKKSIGGVISDIKNKITGQFLPSIKKISDAISDLINGKMSLEEAMNQIFDGLENGINTITEMLPAFLEKGMEILLKIIEGIIEALPELMPAIVQLINTIVNNLVEMLPEILQMGITIILELIKGIAQSLPNLIPAIVDAILVMVDTFLDNIDEIVDVGIELIFALVDGILNALPKLLEKIPEIIIKIVMKFWENFPKIISVGIQLILKLIDGLIKGIPDLIKKVPEIISSIVDTLKEGFSKIVEVGKYLVEGLWEGIKNTGSWLWDKLSGWASDVLSAIGDFFGIASPSKKTMEDGKYLAQGLGKGILKEIPNVKREVDNAMSVLSNEISASVNPVINPTANSNPLIIQIENFNNNRESDIQALAEEMEFYRKNSALAKGGN